MTGPTSGAEPAKVRPIPPRAALPAQCQTPAEKLVLLTIAETCDWQSRRFDKSLDELARISGLCRRSVQSAVTRLRQHGFLHARLR